MGETQAANALDELVPLLYKELRRLAHYHLRRERDGHTLQTTALVHEVYLRLCGQEQPHWQDRAHFFAVAARMMRRILVDYSRRRGAEKRGAAALRLPFDEALGIPFEERFDLIALDEALQELASFDARKMPGSGNAVLLGFSRPRKSPQSSYRMRDARYHRDAGT
jgi:RNA polymerase sigma factor (TIGR02999 family)